MSIIKQAIDALEKLRNAVGHEDNIAIADKALAALKAHQQAVEGVELPPLPEPFVNAHEDAGASYPDTFSGYQMHAYARDAIAAHQARQDKLIFQMRAVAIDLGRQVKELQARQGVPQGYALVPVEPTDEMVNAGTSDWCRYPAPAYRAMVAAAPQPEAPQPAPPLVSAEVIDDHLRRAEMASSVTLPIELARDLFMQARAAIDTHHGIGTEGGKHGV